jgi:hypothetical protein
MSATSLWASVETLLLLVLPFCGSREARIARRRAQALNACSFFSEALQLASVAGKKTPRGYRKDASDSAPCFAVWCPDKLDIALLLFRGVHALCSFSASFTSRVVVRIVPRLVCLSFGQLHVSCRCTDRPSPCLPFFQLAFGAMKFS